MDKLDKASKLEKASKAIARAKEKVREKSKKMILVYCGLCMCFIVGTGVSLRVELNKANEVKQPIRMASVEGNTPMPSLTGTSGTGPMQLPQEIPAQMLAALEAEGLSVEEIGGMQGMGGSVPDISELPGAPVISGMPPNAMGTMESGVMVPKNVAAQAPASSITHEEAHDVVNSLVANTNGFSYMSEEDSLMASHYMHLLNTNPHDYETLILLGGLMLRYNDHNNSLALLEHAQIVSPNEYDAPYHIGLWWLAHQDYDKAVKNFDRALFIKKDPEVLYQLIILHRYSLSDEATAKEYLAQAVTVIDQASPMLKSLIAAEAGK